MIQEKIVDVQINKSLWQDGKKSKGYKVKLDYITLEKQPCGMKCVLKNKEIPCKTEKQAFDLESKYSIDIQNNLNTVADPYLIYSVQCQDDGVHPCFSVYVKYGILLRGHRTKNIPVIVPENCTTIWYNAESTGLSESEWVPSDQMPNIKSVCVPDYVKLPKGFNREYGYVFLNCGFFFDGSDFARAFHDEMLMQQALRRYALYGKIEKTW